MQSPQSGTGDTLAWHQGTPGCVVATALVWWPVHWSPVGTRAADTSFDRCECWLLHCTALAGRGGGGNIERLGQGYKIRTHGGHCDEAGVGAHYTRGWSQITLLCHYRHSSQRGQRTQTEIPHRPALYSCTALYCTVYSGPRPATPPPAPHKLSLLLVTRPVHCTPCTVQPAPGSRDGMLYEQPRVVDIISIISIISTIAADQTLNTPGPAWRRGHARAGQVPAAAQLCQVCSVRIYPTLYQEYLDNV